MLCCALTLLLLLLLLLLESVVPEVLLLLQHSTCPVQGAPEMLLLRQDNFLMQPVLSAGRCGW